jgi:heme-degrading monooxygenase HmoA
MVLTVFRSRLRDDGRAAYLELAPQMSALAQSMPGYRSHKVFVAEDGERVTLVEFDDEQAQRHWSTDPRHVAAKQRGRDSFYAEYTLQVCRVLRESRFSAADAPGASAGSSAP